MQNKTDQSGEWVTSLWNHLCGHVCEWAVPVPNKTMDHKRKIRYAKSKTQRFAPFPCPWCGAATGTFFVPKNQKVISFYNFDVPLMVTRVDNPLEVHQKDWTSTIQELAGTHECCQICGDTEYKTVKMNGAQANICSDCIGFQKIMYESVVE